MKKRLIILGMTIIIIILGVVFLGKEELVVVKAGELKYDPAKNIWVKRDNNRAFTGIVEEKFANGNIYKREKYKNGVLDGISQYYFENGKLKYEGEYKKGKRENIHKLYYDNGELHQSISYKDDKKNGKAEIVIYPRYVNVEAREEYFGERFAGYLDKIKERKVIFEWKENVLCKKIDIVEYKNGSSYEMINTPAEEELKNYLKKAKENEYYYLIEQMNYNRRETYKNEKDEVMGTFINGEKTGIFRIEGDYGIVEVGEFKGENKEGKWTIYLRSGEKVEKEYKDGKLNGVFINYDANGNIIETRYFANNYEQGKFENLLTYEEWVKRGEKGSYRFEGYSRKDRIVAKQKVKSNKLEGDIVRWDYRFYSRESYQNNRLNEIHEIRFNGGYEGRLLEEEMLIKYLEVTPEKIKAEVGIYTNSFQNIKAKYLVTATKSQNFGEDFINSDLTYKLLEYEEKANGKVTIKVANNKYQYMGEEKKDKESIIRLIDRINSRLDIYNRVYDYLALEEYERLNGKR